jgi:hypothetical protein
MRNDEVFAVEKCETGILRLCLSLCKALHTALPSSLNASHHFNSLGLRGGGLTIAVMFSLLLTQRVGN